VSLRRSLFTAWTWRRRTNANCATPSGTRVCNHHSHNELYMV